MRREGVQGKKGTNFLKKLKIGNHFLGRKGREEIIIFEMDGG